MNEYEIFPNHDKVTLYLINFIQFTILKFIKVRFNLLNNILKLHFNKALI